LAIVPKLAELHAQIIEMRLLDLSSDSVCFLWH
jgi:hypothetical protein